MLTRRRFLQAAGGCLTHLAWQAAGSSEAIRRRWTATTGAVVREEPFGRLEAIGTNAWALISTPLEGDRTTFANGGLIAGRTGVVAIEGFYTPEGARWLAEQARALTGRWPTHVVLTHYHVDHASGVDGYGAAALAAGGAAALVHTTTNTRARATSGSPVAPRDSAAMLRALADVVVVPGDATHTIDLGDRQVILQPLRGHTDSDLVVSDPDAGVQFSGDLLWNGMFPNFVDAAPLAWRDSVRTVAAARSRWLVPGHGAVVAPEALDRFAGLLDALEDAARRGHAAGRTSAEAAASFAVPSSLGEWMASRGGVERAMTAWYRAL